MASINAELLARNFVDKLPEFQGSAITDLVATVEQVEGIDPTTQGGTQSPEQHKPHRGPTLLHKPDARNYFRLTELPSGAEISCATADCTSQAVLLLDSRDCEVLPYCKDCANVEHAMWLAGVRR